MVCRLPGAGVSFFTHLARAHPAPGLVLSGRSVVATLNGMTTQVALRKCGDYSHDLEGHVEALLSNLGGLDRFVKPGQRVLLKPNMLTDSPPEKAITTHPQVVRALIRLLKARGITPSVADCSANAGKIEQVWERTGFKAMCAEEGVALLNMEKEGSLLFNVNGLSFTIAKPIIEADVVINVPKIKTHVLTVMTGGVKNMYGAVPGLQKTTLHKLYPSPAQFCRLLAAIYTRTKPALTVADAIVGMEGDGPSGGSAVPLGFIAASADSVALDTIVCRLLGIDPRSVLYLRELGKAGIGETEWDRIEVLGERPEDLTRAGFRQPNTFFLKFIPNWLVKLIGPYVWTRPSIGDRCIGCGQCILACPAGALSAPPRERPFLDPAKCIECCCCHEICQQKAIEMTPSPLLMTIRRLRERR